VKRLCRKEGSISRAELKALRDDLICRGEDAAKNACTVHGRIYVDLKQFVCDKEVLDGKCWIISGRWEYLYRESAVA
jgi:hypothetical protein